MSPHRRLFPVAALLVTLTLLPFASAIYPLDKRPPFAVMVYIGAGGACDDIVSCSIWDTPLPEEHRHAIIILWQWTRDYVCASADVAHPAFGVFLEDPETCMMIVDGYPAVA